MDREIIQKFNNLKIWKRGAESAPHKPLLILYAIEKLLRDGSRLVPYSEIDEDLGKLLQEFGYRQTTQGTEYPFWRLQNDSVWKVTDAHKIVTNSAGEQVERICLSTMFLVVSMNPLPSNFRTILDSPLK